VGFLSNVFGGDKQEDALKEAFTLIKRILEDESFQIELMPPAMREILASRPSFDQDPNGSGPFGLSETNPIPVNGPVGELAYLSKLETQRGERILFHRIGAINTIDVFEAVTFSGSEWFILFVDQYHPRKSRITPNGFRFTQEIGQFSGFHNNCPRFPFDFVQMKQADSTLLSLAYIPISRVAQQIDGRVYQRPLSHKVKLDLVRRKMTSVTLQKDGTSN